MTPATRRPSAALVAVMMALTASCAVPDQKRPVAIQPVIPTTAKPSTGRQSGATVVVYLVGHNERLVAESRSAAAGDAGSAVRALLAGPTRSEVSAGLSTVLPSGTDLLSWRVSGRVAYFDFSAGLASLSGTAQVLAFAQIVATATEVGDVTSVVISIESQAVNAPLPNGTLATGPVSRRDYKSVLGP